MQEPTRIHLHDNTFTGNKATKLKNDWKKCDGGAILYACRPEKERNCQVVLLGNTFD